MGCTYAEIKNTNRKAEFANCFSIDWLVIAALKQLYYVEQCDQKTKV